MTLLLTFALASAVPVDDINLAETFDEARAGIIQQAEGGRPLTRTEACDLARLAAEMRGDNRSPYVERAYRELLEILQASRCCPETDNG